MSATPTRREPTMLADLATAIQSEHDAAQDAFRSAVEHAIRCGELLAEAKAQVGHGDWLPWLEENFPASRRTAQGYMRLAAHAEDAQALAHLGIEGALKQLAEPKVSDDLAHRRVQHVAAEDDLRDGLRAWLDESPEEVEIAFTAACITYNQLAQAGAHTDFGYQDFDAYLADRLGDVEAELAELQLGRDGSAVSQTAREVDQDDDPPAGLDHLGRAEWYIDRADAKVAAAASDLLAWADEIPEQLSGLSTAARRYAHLLLAQPEPWGELSDAKDWARQEFKAAIHETDAQEALS